MKSKKNINKRVTNKIIIIIIIIIVVVVVVVIIIVVVVVIIIVIIVLSTLIYTWTKVDIILKIKKIKFVNVF